MTTLLDSCILIDCLARHAPARACIQSQVRPAISLITWMEVMVGGPKAGNDPIVRKFLDAFEILPIDDDIAEATVAIRRTRRLKLPDAILLATARVHRLTFVTRNTKDFEADEPGILIPYRIL